MTANIYSFQRWKEFSLEQPEETIYTYLRNVLDNTNLKGKLKHNNQIRYFIESNSKNRRFQLTDYRHYLNVVHQF